MKKLFISQPMVDKTDEEILNVREAAIEEAKKLAGDDDVEIIDSFMQGAPHDAKPLWFLGKSFQMLSMADYAYFADGWSDYRGCNMEHLACEKYGIKIIHD